MAEIDVENTFQIAIGHHQAGRVLRAEELYREILGRQADHIGAMLNLGVIAGEAGRNEEAVELFGRAVAAAPEIAEGHYNFGNALKNLGRVEEAIAQWRKAVGLRPGYVEAQFNLGNGLREMGRFEEAAGAYRKCISGNSCHAEANHNLGIALRGAGQAQEAEEAFRRAIGIKPGYAGAHCSLGVLLREKGLFEEAVVALQSAVALEPGHAEAWNNLGIALGAGGNLDEAARAHRRAIAIRAGYAEAHSSLGIALRGKGEFAEAIGEFRRAIKLKPELAEGHHNLALTLLLRGEWKEGWKEYEWRWKTWGFASAGRRFSQPVWDGGDLVGRVVLLYAEQGMGDTIHFIRYVPMVLERGGRVICEVQPGLVRLLQQVRGVERWVARGEELPAFDVQCSLLSLPGVFGTTVERAAVQRESLRAEEELGEAWRKKVNGEGVKVGVVWAGGPKFAEDRKRSVPLNILRPLSSVERVVLYSLQKGDAAREVNLQSGLRLVDLSEELKDFADTAAAIGRMDLVITVDTSVAHLAGAMGKAVWVMLPFVPDWRWLLEREDSVWYPTMRLFRQRRAGDWGEVVSRVAVALEEFAMGWRA